ncbi:MAG: hypothetical protein LVQ97_01420 [Candidatus Micrarchaeales archaeon]|jgi:predicted RNA-binding Zn-ribbon protein involved in translation (DUF1610 family)|uniref:Uncharacterized protein n=1 Tax=Candidatus Micrarchaeum acidiphilum ARMAN-2 TaxID=425595 RepID=C7DI06_MICA2|nr:MAG: hypothetical protein UNLARM2_0699 [Candidatus Micrarchaeum acidiphilum ARMAN-2]MCW6160827.1 hypothetical protein [Candidatus Micrarchaeales archaeon]
MEASISESPSHSIKLEYLQNGVQIVLLWEQIGGDYALQTAFDANGGIIDQVLSKLSGRTLRDSVDGFIERNGIEPRESVFEEVKLKKSCPKCGKMDLVRAAESAGNASAIPVMPIYICGSCGSKSYYLTDAYLAKLVVKNKELFDPKELADIDRLGEEAFMKELREYIVRVFAAKKISNIR